MKPRPGPRPSGIVWYQEVPEGLSEVRAPGPFLASRREIADPLGPPGRGLVDEGGRAYRIRTAALSPLDDTGMVTARPLVTLDPLRAGQNRDGRLSTGPGQPSGGRRPRCTPLSVSGGPPCLNPRRRAGGRSTKVGHALSTPLCIEYDVVCQDNNRGQGGRTCV
jgi:hypothetical protein